MMTVTIPTRFGGEETKDVVLWSDKLWIVLAWISTGDRQRRPSRIIRLNDPPHTAHGNRFRLNSPLPDALLSNGDANVKVSGVEEVKSASMTALSPALLNWASITLTIACMILSNERQRPVCLIGPAGPVSGLAIPVCLTGHVDRSGGGGVAMPVCFTGQVDSSFGSYFGRPVCLIGPAAGPEGTDAAPLPCAFKGPEFTVPV